MVGRKLLLVLGLVIGAGLALEGGLRGLREDQLGIPQDERLAYRHHPRLGWLPEPGSARELEGARRVHVAHNLEGFRDRDHGAKRRPRLLFVGDSYVWGYDVEASERFSDLLQARLAGVDILNLGVSGYGTDQQYLLLQQVLERYDADWVVMVMGPNDALDNRRNHVSGRYWKPWFALEDGEPVLRGTPVPVSLAYVQREHPILLASYLVRAGVQAFLRLTGPVPRLHPDDPSEALVAAASRLVRDHGAEFGLAWVGTRGLPDEVVRWLEGQVGPEAASLRFPADLCRREGIPCLDLSHDLSYPSHGWHWTPEGHREVAERLVRFLRDQDWTAPGPDPLHAVFVDPPAQARPFVRWWWNGNAVREDEIVRELDALRRAGFGGVEINPIEMPEEVPRPRPVGLRWLGPEWTARVGDAARAARERGLHVDLLLGSGWPVGGAFLGTSDTLERVRVHRRRLPGPGLTRHAGEAAAANRIFLRLVAEDADSPGDARDLTFEIGRDNNVLFELPAGPHWLYEGELQQPAQSVRFGAPGGGGPVLDPMSRPATERYLEHFSAALQPVLGPRLGDFLRSVFVDSFELGGANWTSDLREQFRARRGYAVEPYLPFVLQPPAAGDPFADSDEVRRARYDFSLTLTELFHERFVAPFRDWCRAQGVQSRVQGYGSPWLRGMLGTYLQVDIPEGDTWVYRSHSDTGPALDNVRYAVWNKYASSAAHLAGRSVASSEVLTNLKGVFRVSLEDAKQAADLTFATGVNQLVAHGFNYSPPDAAFPGWLRFGTWFSEANPWWPQLRRWSDYVARLSAVFQASAPVAQLAILGPTADVWSHHGLDRPRFVGTPWYLHELWQALQRSGYSADFVDESVIRSASVEGARLRFGPMSFEALIVADAESVEPETAEAIETFAAAGGRVLFVGRSPSRSPGLRNAGRDDSRVREAIARATRSGMGRVAVVPRPARGSVDAWARTQPRAFGLEPAVNLQGGGPRLFQLHRRFRDRDLFWFANIDRENPTGFDAVFAPDAGTPWRWDPESGARSVFRLPDADGRLRIELAPLESLLLVLEPEGSPDSPQPLQGEGDSQERAIDAPWQVRFHPIGGEPFERRFDTLLDLSKDPTLVAFSGTAVYRTEFEAGETAGAELWLGRVAGLSQARLNGWPLGTRWWGRHRYDASGAIRVGTNRLEVTVTTTAFNYARSLRENRAATRWVQDRRAEPAGLLGPVRWIQSTP